MVGPFDFAAEAVPSCEQQNGTELNLCLATKTEARIPGFSFAAKNRRTRQNTGWYFPGIVAILLNLAANQPETRLTEVRARKNDDSTEFRIYHTTLCSYHTTPQENQISGKYHSFTSKWQAL